MKHFTSHCIDLSKLILFHTCKLAYTFQAFSPITPRFPINNFKDIIYSILIHFISAVSTFLNNPKWQDNAIIFPTVACCSLQLWWFYKSRLSPTTFIRHTINYNFYFWKTPTTKFIVNVLACIQYTFEWYICTLKYTHCTRYHYAFICRHCLHGWVEYKRFQFSMSKRKRRPWEKLHSSCPSPKSPNIQHNKSKCTF